MLEAQVARLAAPAPREYQHLLRGPHFAWWRPVLTLVLACLLGLLFWLLAFGLAYLMGAEDFPMEDPGAFTLGNLAMASLIPASLLAVAATHRDSAHFISSVARRVRWRWMLRCFAVIAPLFAVYVGVDLLLDPPSRPGPEQAFLFLLLILVGTPLQAAGEEYLFRGIVLQNVGAWFRHPRVALVVATSVSTVLFVAAHGSADPWIVIDLAITSVACCYLAWRTGGLEAPIALHAVNNMVGMAGSVIFGGWGEGFIDASSRGHVLDPLLTLIVCVLAVRLVLAEATRRAIPSVHSPHVMLHGATPTA
jgi:membrane protease YdiL (CAAX protease family)